MGGWDTDSNGATVGSVVGALTGAAALPAAWSTPLRNRLATSLPGFDGIGFDELAARTADGGAAMTEPSTSSWSAAPTWTWSSPVHGSPRPARPCWAPDSRPTPAARAPTRRSPPPGPARDTAFVGALGDDDVGARCCATLPPSRRRHLAGPRACTGPTGTALITVRRRRREHDRGRARRPNATPDAASTTRTRGRDRERRRPGRQLEIPLAAVDGGGTAARAAGVRVVLNAAPARRCPTELLRTVVDLLVVNEHEARHLSGDGEPRRGRRRRCSTRAGRWS